MRAALALAACALLLVGAHAEPMVGGVSAGDSSSPEAREAASAAVASLASNSNSLEPLALGRVVEVKQQVVAGTMYTITCEVLRGAETSLMELRVWRKLDGTHEAVESKTLFVVRGEAGGVASAGMAAPQLGLVGGYHPAEPSDPNVRSAAVEAWRTTDGAMGDGVVVRVCKAEKQVVNGVNYRLTLGDEECAETHPITVYQSFQGEYSVMGDAHNK
eukprot:CAMPEP_0183791622 /NCGR_PEP_ID=MMETSP0803_2-20130417/1982_1 /TAXON_ID=195967 /ORGANISM="Crustomastix stigmata, Strain CCMP3273" /LENGTH=216 /DNA_ID=CAMNT_0026035943 /DNA_START=43 /DNA_END=693 /DNA_ORIENTATION=-